MEKKDIIDVMYPFRSTIVPSELHDYTVFKTLEQRFKKDEWTFKKNGWHININILTPEDLFKLHDRLLLDTGHILFRDEWIDKIEQRFRDLNLL